MNLADSEKGNNSGSNTNNNNHNNHNLANSSSPVDIIHGDAAYR